MPIVVNDKGITVTRVVSILEQWFPSVPVTVYVLVEAGINPTPFVTPPVHEYDNAPSPLSITEVPEHTVEALVLAVTVGKKLTMIVVTAELEQLFPSVPVTAYIVVDDGETVMELLVAPFDQAYVVPPLAINVLLFP